MEEESSAHLKEEFVSALRAVLGEPDDANARFINLSRVPLICQSIIRIGTDISTINEKLDKKFVTVERFAPIERGWYGLISFVVLAVLGALVMLVIKK